MGVNGLNLRNVAMPAVSHAGDLVTIRLDEQVFAVSADVARGLAAALTSHAGIVEQQAGSAPATADRLMGNGYR